MVSIVSLDQMGLKKTRLRDSASGFFFLRAEMLRRSQKRCFIRVFLSYPQGSILHELDMRVYTKASVRAGLC